MGRYDAEIEGAAEQLREDGQLVTWQKIVDGTPADAAKPWKPGEATVTEYPVYIVFLPDDRQGYQVSRYGKGTEVPRGSEKGLMAAQDFEPAIKDTIVRDGKTLSICGINPLRPNGQVIMYELWFDL